MPKNPRPGRLRPFAAPTQPTPKFIPQDKKYQFWSDPGHGWLAVPWIDCKNAGILHKISPFSYYDGLTVYLEEDMDASTFINAVRNDESASDWNQQNTTHYYKSPRDYGHYHVQGHQWDSESKQWVPE